VKQFDWFSSISDNDVVVAMETPEREVGRRRGQRCFDVGTPLALCQVQKPLSSCVNLKVNNI